MEIYSSLLFLLCMELDRCVRNAYYMFDLSLVFLKLLRNKDRELNLRQAQCLDDDIIPEAEMDTLKADLSLSSDDKNDSEPVF